jgi:hypothetical protein
MTLGRSAGCLTLLALFSLGAAPPSATTPSGGRAAGGGASSLEVSADRRAITVGDPVVLTIRLACTKGTRVGAFDPERSLGALTVLERRSDPPRTLDDGRVEEVRTLKVTTYQVGPSEVPAIEASCADPSGTVQTVTSVPIPFEVASVLASDDSQPADIKAPAVMPARPLWPVILGILAAALAAAGWLWRRRQRRRPEQVPVTSVPARPPDEIAYAELERLLTSGLLEKGRLKEFYIELAEIVKRYLAARFGVETFERTSLEILQALHSARLPARVSGAVGEFFEACDLVKFAKHLPGHEETRATVGRAYKLVDETRPSQPTAAEDQNLALAGAGQGRRGAGP